MRQDEERTTEHHHTPSIKARQPGRRKSNQIPRGRDQHKHWARTPRGTNHRGREATRDRGGEQTTAKKRTNAKEPHHTKRGTQGPKEKTPAETQAKAQTQQTTPQTGARHERKRDTKPRTNQRQGKHGPHHEHANKRPNHKKRGGPGGELDPKKAAKRPPPHSSKRGQITTRCPGTRGTGDQTGRKEKHETKGREEEGGGSLRHTPCSVFKVVLFI